MAMNPLAYTENVVSNFLRYQLTAYPFADPGPYAQMRDFSLQERRRRPLLQGPLSDLSRACRQGARVADLVAEGFRLRFPELVVERPPGAGGGRPPEPCGFERPRP